jgi:hypothetical protein
MIICLHRIKKNLSNLRRSYRESQFDFLKLKVKDSETNKKFKQHSRKLTENSAKSYCVILLFHSVLMLPCYIPFGKDAVIYLAAGYISTLAAVLLCLAAARWRLVFIEFNAPLTVLFRSFAIYGVVRQTNFDGCIPNLLDDLYRFFTLAALLGELIILRPNVYLTAFIIAPLFLGLSALTKSVR